MELYYRVEIDGKEHSAPISKVSSRTLHDEYRAILDSGIEVAITIENDSDLGVSKCQSTVTNNTGKAVSISRADVAWKIKSTSCILQYYHSNWGSEFSPARKKISAPFVFGTFSGRSSNGCDPWFGLELDDGFCSATIACSGNWDAKIIPLSDGEYLACMGISAWKFFHNLNVGETFDGAEIHITQIESNMEQSCYNLRRYFKKHISIVDMTQETLPIAYNAWWPHEDKTINQSIMFANAKVAAEIGCTNATMDAGWFGENKNWVETRGDWDIVNLTRFPMGMDGLGESINSLGIKFGVWCEIEAVGPNARLNETHPEIIARKDGNSLGYICMASETARRWALDVLSTIVQKYGASWIKLDFNLDPGCGCDCTLHGHGKNDGVLMHYIGFHKMLADFRKLFPSVTLEACSSGGLRFDYQTLQNHHYAFLSDPDYTEHHLQCFWGATSFVHPSSCFHFSWSQTLIRDNIDREPINEQMSVSRFDYIIRAALLGVPGFSYRLIDFPEWCRNRLKEHIEFYKETSAKFILHGEMYRLTEQPLRGGYGERYPAFQYIAQNGDSLIFVFRLEEGELKQTVYPRGLTGDTRYNVSFCDSISSMEMSGMELMQNGLTFSTLQEEGSEIAKISKIN